MLTFKEWFAANIFCDGETLADLAKISRTLAKTDLQYAVELFQTLKI